MPPMPEIKPFRGIRFTASVPFKDLVCPPYDVISPDEQKRLHEVSKFNAVRLELPLSDETDPTERPRKAAAQFDAWVDAGVLVADGQSSLYVYRQDYELPGGTRGRVAGVVGALQLEEFGGRAGVLPHERTMPGPIEERLALIRACPLNISPIYAIYRGGGSLAPYVDSLEHRPPAARFTDASGTLHRLWAIDAPAEIEMLSGALRPGPLVIADGHHRYETALAYHRERGDSPGGHDAVMCFCVDADVEDLVVYPFHRIVTTSDGRDAVKQRAVDRFGGRLLGPAESAAALDAASGDHPMVVVAGNEDVLIDVSATDVEVAVGERVAAWRALDVVALHEVVFPALSDDVPELSFTRDEDDVRRRVSGDPATWGVLLRPPTATDVIEVARAGERMPQKASYFWPKAVTGLVFRPLE
jgi:uncharacterized protein (DUF1015 family)